MHLSITESIIVFYDSEFFLVNYCHVVVAVVVVLGGVLQNFLIFQNDPSA